ncbi:MAG TPA: RICIN domain-containing protein [Opitutaceae bacterium]|nr:RICIN domain-containing protein [Opitutaceae bacterium]
MNPKFAFLRLGALALAGVSPLAAQTFTGHFEIISASSGIVCEVKGASTAGGAAIDQYVANNGSNQHWSIITVSTGQYEIQNVGSGLVLEVPGSSTAAGTNCDQAAYTGGKNQLWKITSIAGGKYTLANVNSGLVLDVRGASSADAALIDQYTSNSGANQQWFIVVTGNPAGTVSPASGGAGAAASTFHGFNWAVQGDNFQDNFLFLSGQAAGNSYATVESLTGVVAGAFKGAGATALRIPINPATALGTWWPSYKGVIDQAAALGLKVIVSNWSGSTDENGTVPDAASFYLMWDTVVNAYNGNGNVYFEVFNEPHGYSTANWLSVVQTWLARYPTVPRGRVFVGGTGYSQNIPNVASSSITSGCLFSCHDYGFFSSSQTTNAYFYSNLSGQVGTYASRTVLTEFGAEMTTGLNYQGGSQGSNSIASVIGFCDFCHDNSMGSVYWPGERIGDTYSMYTLNGTSSMTLNNSGGLELVQYGWGASAGGN